MNEYPYEDDPSWPDSEGIPPPVFELPARLTFSNILSIGHDVYKSRWGLLAGAMTIATLIAWISTSLAIVVDLVIYAAVLPSLVGKVPVYPLSILVQATLGTHLTVGPIYIAARIYRGEHVQLDDMFIAFRRWPQIFAIGLALQIANVLISAPLQVAAVFLQTSSGTPVMMLAGMAVSLLTSLISLYIAVRFYFAPLLCADPAGPRLSITASITESWRITRPYAISMCFAMIVLGILAALTLMCILIPFFLYGGPLIAASGGAAYAIACHNAGVIPLAPYQDCPICGYDLNDSDTSTCPECGADVPRNTNEVPDLYETPSDHQHET